MNRFYKNWCRILMGLIYVRFLDLHLRLFNIRRQKYCISQTEAEEAEITLLSLPLL